MEILLSLCTCVFFSILHISRYSPKRHILILTCFVRLLYQLEIPAIIIKQVVPNTTVFGILFIRTIVVQSGFIVSEKEIKSFNGREACVGFSFLVAPEDRLLCLYLYGF